MFKCPKMLAYHSGGVWIGPTGQTRPTRDSLNTSNIYVDSPALLIELPLSCKSRAHRSDSPRSYCREHSPAHQTPKTSAGNPVPRTNGNLLCLVRVEPTGQTLRGLTAGNTVPHIKPQRLVLGTQSRAPKLVSSAERDPPPTTDLPAVYALQRLRPRPARPAPAPSHWSAPLPRGQVT